MSDVDDKEPEEAPDRMVRRTRKVRKKRKTERSASENKDHANTLFAKAKDLLVGMEDERDDHGHVDVAEQIRRLKKKKEDDRPLDEVWGTKKRSTTWLWIVLVGLIVSVFAIMVGVTMWVSEEPRGNTETDIDPLVGTVTEMDLSKGPLGWFNESSIEVLDSAKDLIEIANTAGDSATLAGIVRDSPFRKLSPIQPEQWGSDYLTSPTSNFAWLPKVVNSSEGAKEAKRGYLMISGTRVDGNPFEAYFVKDDDKVVLDWDATMGWSEMSVPEIVNKMPRKEMFLRCRVTKKPSYDQDFGKVNYSGYVISGESIDQFFFAYVPLNTDRSKVIDRDLKLLLNYGSFVTPDEPPLQDQKATLRVRYGDEAGNKEIFEIVEFLHDGWVSP